MNPVLKHTLVFFLILLAINIAVGCLHGYLLIQKEISLDENLFLRAYIVNFLLAIVIFIILELVKKRLVTSLGFIYMAGSLVKFTGFFIFFYPTYNSDGDIGKPEFITFFVPYAVCLAFETYYLVQMLNNSKN